MTSKADKDKIKQLQDKCQSVLNALLRDEDNKYCVDCDSKGPRWASWNIGVFLCIRCAGIHRNLGVHISKVKSVNLDSWTPEQVVSLQQMGNSRARAVYEANLPDNHRRPQSDSALETFIRAKYEHKKYIAGEWVPPVLPKVNWEKEIDEELDRQRRKKKSSSIYLETKPICNVEVPQLPKPTNPSPKPIRQGNLQTKQNKREEDKCSVATDLLVLQNGEDGFGGFLSASMTDNKKIGADETAQSEEESFFNQLAPTEKEKAKLTKDSILALYSNAPTVNKFNGTFPNQSFQSAQSQQATFNYYRPAVMGGQFNAPTFSQHSNPQYTQQYQPTQFANTCQNFSNTAPTSSFAHISPQFTAQSATFPSQFTVGQSNVSGGNLPTNLPQQFGNLTLNGQPNSSNPTVASSNLWQ